MKQLTALSLFIFLSLAIRAQQPAYPPLDKSPMDMSYYPVNYPILKIQGKATEPLIARVIYGRPQKQGREIFGQLEPYGSVWRLGANEATEIEFYKDVKIAGKKVPRGRYTLYALLDSAKWTLIVNKDTDTWGAFRYDSSKDLVRAGVPVNQQPDITEVFTMLFEKNTANSASLVIAWDKSQVKLPFSW